MRQRVCEDFTCYDCSPPSLVYTDGDGNLYADPWADREHWPHQYGLALAAVAW